VLVNDIWGGDALVRWGAPFWEHDLDAGLRAWRNAVETHLITSHRLVPLLVANAGGLVIEVTDGDSDRYRGSLFYDLAKASTIRLALAQASELAPYGVAAVSLTPGFLRSEAMLDHFGVDETSWRDGIVNDPHFALSETPAYVGRAAAALAADPDVVRWSGRALSVITPSPPRLPEWARGGEASGPGQTTAASSGHSEPSRDQARGVRADVRSSSRHRHPAQSTPRLRAGAAATRTTPAAAA
jgi:NAD(P)-dependent dehydrogenase (short-subunit alcohol dehydrogenase family)